MRFQTELQSNAYRFPKATADQILDQKHTARFGRVLVGLTVNK
jgi:hypothetical protein